MIKHRSVRMIKAPQFWMSALPLFPLAVTSQHSATQYGHSGCLTEAAGSTKVLPEITWCGIELSSRTLSVSETGRPNRVELRQSIWGIPVTLGYKAVTVPLPVDCCGACCVQSSSSGWPLHSLGLVSLSLSD